MTSHSHYPPDLDADSVTSSPRSDHFHDAPPRIRFMCSFGGKILPRPHDNQLRYVGGDTRIVAVNRSITFSALILKLSKLSGPNNTTFSFHFIYIYQGCSGHMLPTPSQLQSYYSDTYS